jgi:hypothetical protein
MKKILLIAALMLTALVHSQITTPPSSPVSKLHQQIGLTDVTIEYARPSAKSRTIFGDLVPYGKLWRTGANARTKITFNNDVEIGGKSLKKGTYAIFSIPGKNKWEIIFYTESEGWGAPRELDENKVALKVSSTPIETAMFTESFTIHIDNLRNNSATIFLLWEKTMVPLNISVPTDAQVMANIEKVFSGPGAMDYYAAAVYYFEEGKDINKAKEWIDMALAGNDNPPFWQLRQQSLIYARAGDMKGAIEIAKKSLAAAEKAGNEDYIKMNKDALKEWGAK